MKTIQSVCLIAALALFIVGAGLIETQTVCGLTLLALMPIPMYIGKLDKKRVSAADIERRCRDAENR